MKAGSVTENFLRHCSEPDCHETSKDRSKINGRQFGGCVLRAAWTFPICGYLPAQRWLKDVIGRTLSYGDKAEYQRIIWALMETRRLMAEIDISFQQHGRWPLK